MKTVHFGRALVLFTLIAAGESVFAGSEGGGSTGGGSVVRNEQGELVPADVYFKSRGYQLPSHYLHKLNLDDYPGLAGEITKLMQFVENRARVDKPLRHKLEQFEFYATEKLSGDDVLSVETTGRLEQAAYTYTFRELSDDFAV